GELGWIVMKALEKDRNRRYETANRLAMDARRYVADEPVQACPPPVVYRFRKLARRHKAIAAATTRLFLALLLGSVTLWRELRQRDAAEAAVEAALERTERLQDQGRYEEAMGVLAAAEGHLAGGRLGVLRERVARSKRDLEMLTRLESAYLQIAAAGKDTGWDTAGFVQLLSEAFAWYGLDVSTMDPPEIAERV